MSRDRFAVRNSNSNAAILAGLQRSASPEKGPVDPQRSQKKTRTNHSSTITTVPSNERARARWKTVLVFFRRPSSFIPAFPRKGHVPHASMTPSAFLSPTGFGFHRVELQRRPELAVLQRQRLYRAPKRHRIAACSTHASAQARTCVRCGATFLLSENAPGRCRYHGDVLGNVQTLNLYEGT